MLLTPVLAALERGNLLQRAAVLKAFDGSFFKGRFYARQPEDMIDVGNDREFGFLYEPPLDAARADLRLAPGRRPAPRVARRQAIQLCSFFKLPDRTSDATIQAQLLRRAGRPGRRRPRGGTAVVGGELASERRWRTIARRRRRPSGRCCSNRAKPARPLLAAIGRKSRLASRPEIQAAIREPACPRGCRRRLCSPCWAGPSSPMPRSWASSIAAGPKLTQPQRIDRTRAPLRPARACSTEADPPEQAVELLLRAVTDPSPCGPRADALRAQQSAVDSGRAERVRPAAQRAGRRLARAAEARPDPGRIEGLVLGPARRPRASGPAPGRSRRRRSARRPSTWSSIIAWPARAPPLARRVKALAADPSLSARAEAVLRAAGLDPAAVKADVSLTRPRLLSLATFRRTVNPLFYQAGEDSYACARTATPTTRSCGSPRPTRRGLSGEQLMINYNSALKVVNLGEPESSLILRKPRSPAGPGGARASSPTGLTHVGGPRWESTEHPAYQAILAWIREAKAAAGSSAASLTLTADSHAPGYEPALAGDGDLSTLWQTEFIGATPGYPHELTIDLGAARTGRRAALHPPPGWLERPGPGLSRSASRPTASPGRLPSPAAPGPTTRRSSRSPCPAHRPLRPAPRPERGERPARHERGGDLRRFDHGPGSASLKHVGFLIRLQ